MTRVQRAQVVELLRCAAANRSSINRAASALEEATPGLEISVRDVVCAIDAHESTRNAEPAGEYWNVCEKAAARVEEGTWP